MGRKTIRENYHVIVYPRAAGDFGSIRTSAYQHTPEQEKRLCEDIAEQIRRHVNDLPSDFGRGVSIQHETRYACEHCGWRWTEGEKGTHNGGCCAKDAEVYEAALVQESE